MSKYITPQTIYSVIQLYDSYQEREFNFRTLEMKLQTTLAQAELAVDMEREQTTQLAMVLQHQKYVHLLDTIRWLTARSKNKEVSHQYLIEALLGQLTEMVHLDSLCTKNQPLRITAI